MAGWTSPDRNLNHWDGTLSAIDFEGDGSKLTNLPAPDLTDYARLDGATFTGDVNINAVLNVVDTLSNDANGLFTIDGSKGTGSNDNSGLVIIVPNTGDDFSSQERAFLIKDTWNAPLMRIQGYSNEYNNIFADMVYFGNLGGTGSGTLFSWNFVDAYDNTRLGYANADTFNSSSYIAMEFRGDNGRYFNFTTDGTMEAGVGFKCNGNDGESVTLYFDATNSGSCDSATFTGGILTSHTTL